MSRARDRGRRTLMLLLALVPLVATGVLLVLALKPASPGATELGPRVPLTGAQSHSLWAGSSLEDATRELDMLQSAGANTVRLDLSWSSLEHSGRGQFAQWYVDKADAVFDAAAARGLKVVAALHTTPCWASSAPDELRQGCTGAWWDRNVQKYPPIDAADYGDAAAWVARRWGGRMAALEIWNEPNETHQNFLVSPDPAADYASLVKAAYGPVKSARPELPVLAGATSFADREFINRLYDLGIKDYHDGISIHPYNEERDPDDPRTPGLEKWTFRSGVPWVRESMVTHGDGDKDLWLTEFGWSTCDPGSSSWCVSEAQQSEYVNDVFRNAREDRWTYVKAMLVYDLRNKGTSATDREAQFGLLRRDYSAKPGWEGFRNAIDSNPPDTKITSGPSGTAGDTSVVFRFESTEAGSFECKLDVAVWESCATRKSYSGLLQGEHTFSVRAIDAAGNVDATPSTRTFTVDSEPPVARATVQTFVQPSRLGIRTVPLTAEVGEAVPSKR